MPTTYNFNPGPATLPRSVLSEVKKNFLNWNNSGCSIVEISHRSHDFIEYTFKVEKNLRYLLDIPNNYCVLFSHGGARGQFSAIPINLSKKSLKPCYINSGYWSLCAAEESKKYCKPSILDVRKMTKDKKIYIQPTVLWEIPANSSYLHYCPNETIEGIEIFENPIFYKTVIIGDFSSTILSRKIDIKKYGMIYACAQKNIGPTGITVIIIRKDLLTQINKKTPSILNYQVLAQSQSMFNTPNVFSWYVSGLVFQWMKDLGGIEIIEKKNKEKAKILYQYLSTTDFYKNFILPVNQSRMNITFYLPSHELTSIFLQKAEKNGLVGLKGHSMVGGIRASIYNAMPVKGILLLVDFMKNFEKKFG
ncbi:3-phosphoserine/phosphohydroxythreonine transaminase [Buchnera aphidicola]|uniref:3-phosphoserine/phosphohydroxythreonine transaminase n=1 Tax=Buchnera aphidicola TaxID=9 RepID=UPI00094CCEE8|nr:3-phosphoserine/phosphohydroxythreonine transaminase [Buchnera aphidicola]